MLTINYKKCPKATRDRITDGGYALGITLMAIGLGKITGKNRVEAQVRMDLYRSLFGELLKGCTARDLVGAEANVIDETRAKWTKRIMDHWYRENDYQVRELFAGLDKRDVIAEGGDDE